MNAGTLAGNFTCNGNVVLGNATSDTITLTGIVSIGTSGSYLANLLGSAALPTYTFTGDLNTGVWSSGADNLSISTAGVQRINVDASGDSQFGAIVAPVNSTAGRKYLTIEALTTGLSVIQFGNASGVTSGGLGQLEWYNRDNSGSSTFRSAFIQVGVEGSTANNRGAYVLFGVKADGVSGGGATAFKINNATQLEANLGTVSLPSYTFTSDLNTGMWSSAADTVNFSTGGSERMRIDSAGSIIINATSSIGATTSKLQINDDQATVGGISINRFINSTSGNSMAFTKSRNATVGSHTIVNSGDSIGSIPFYGSDGTNYVVAAQIQGAVDGTPGTNDMPGRLVFSTTADGASSLSERMRIDSSGKVGIGITPTSLLHVSGSVSSADLVTLQKSTASTGITTDYAQLSLYNNNNTTNSYNSIWFYGNNSGSSKQGYAAIGSVFTTTTASSEAGALTFYTRTGGGAVTERLRIEGSGRIYASSAIQRALGSTPDSTSTTTCYIEAGTFTSTITNGTNVSSTGTLTMHWQRIGNIVTCGFQCSSIIASSGTSVLTNFKFTLPISATYSAATNLNGTGVVDPGTTGTRAPAMVYGVSSSGLQAQFEYLAVNTTNSGLYGTFTYLVQ